MTTFTQIVTVPPLSFDEELLVIGDRAVFVEKMNRYMTKIQAWTNDFASSINSINSFGGELATSQSQAETLLLAVQSLSAELTTNLESYNTINGVTQAEINSLAADIATAVAAAGGVVSTSGNQIIAGQKTFTSRMYLDGTAAGIDITTPEGNNGSLAFNRNEVDRASIFYSTLGDSLALQNFVNGTLSTGITLGNGSILLFGDLRASVQTSDLSDPFNLVTKSYVDLHARTNLDNTWTGIQTFTAQIKAPDGTSTLPALRFGADDNIGWWRVNNQRLALKILDDDVMHWERTSDGSGVTTYGYGGTTDGHEIQLHKSTGDPGVAWVGLQAPAAMPDWYNIIFPTTRAQNVGETLVVESINLTLKQINMAWGAGSGSSDVIEYVQEMGNWNFTLNNWISGHNDNQGAENYTWNEAGGSAAAPTSTSEWKMMGIYMEQGDVLEELVIQNRVNQDDISEIDYVMRFKYTNTLDYTAPTLGNATWTFIDVKTDKFFYPSDGLLNWDAGNNRQYRRRIAINYTAPQDGDFYMWVKPTFINGQTSDETRTILRWKVRRSGSSTSY